MGTSTSKESGGVLTVCYISSQRVSRPGFDRDRDGGVYPTLEVCSFSLGLWPWIMILLQVGEAKMSDGA